MGVEVPAGAVGEFSPPELTFCADSYSVSIPLRVTTVAHERPVVILPKCKRQVTPKQAYTLDQKMLEWAYYAIQALCGHLAGKQAHTQFVWKHSATVVSAH